MNNQLLLRYLNSEILLSLSYYCLFGMTMNFTMGFPSGSDGKESTCSAGDLGWEDPLEKIMATLSSILACRIP